MLCQLAIELGDKSCNYSIILDLYICFLRIWSNLCMVGNHWSLTITLILTRWRTCQTNNNQPWSNHFAYFGKGRWRKLVENPTNNWRWLIKIKIRVPVLSCIRKWPIIKFNWLRLCSAKRWGKVIPPYSNGPKIIDRAVCWFIWNFGSTVQRPGDSICLHCWSVRFRAGKGKLSFGIRTNMYEVFPI